MSAKDHERYFQRIPSLSQHRTMFRGYVDLCLKFVNVCDCKSGALNSDTEIVTVWSSLLQPLGQMLNLLFQDHLRRTSNQWLINIPKPKNLDIIIERLTFLKDDGIYEQFYNYDFDGDQRFKSGVQQIMSQLKRGKEDSGQENLDLLLQAKLFYFSRFYFEIELEGYETWLKEKCKETFEPISENDVTSTEDESEILTNATDCSSEEQVVEGDIIPEEENIEENSRESAEIIKELEQATDFEEETHLLTDEEKVRKFEDTERQHLSAVGGQVAGGAAGGAANSEMLLPVATSQLQESHSLELPSGLNTNLVTDPKLEGAVAMEESSDNSSLFAPSFMQILQLVQEGKDIPGVEDIVVEPTNKPPTASKMERTPKPWEQ
ncbi:uncharacterized protein [Antedon mediterranea]